MKKIIATYFLLMIGVGLHAQTTIKGFVRDHKFLPIEGASVRLSIDTVGAVTDSLGSFSFKSMHQGEAWLIALQLGLKADSTKVLLDGSLILRFLTLKDNNQLLNTVQIQSRKAFNPPSQDLSHAAITIAMAPGAAADVAAAMQVFPGAAPTANETGFFVRGGQANETGFVFDGLLVKNPYGSKLPDIANRSRFSAFLFDQTDFTTNGFSAMYGQALSSVMRMETRGLPHKSSTEFSLLSLGMGAARTERFKNSSVTVGANYYNFANYHKVIKQNTLWQKAPVQYQTSLQFKHKTKKGMVKAFVDYSDTDLSFDVQNPNQAANDLLENRNKNLYVNTNYQEQIHQSWNLYVGTAYNYTSESGSYANQAYYQYDKLLQQKIMFTTRLTHRMPFRFGAEYFFNNRDEGIHHSQRAYKDVLAAAFTELDVHTIDVLSFNFGLRAEHSRHMQRWNSSPRVMAIYNPVRDHKITASYGQYFQKPDDSFLTVSSDLNFEQNTQIAMDYEFPILRRLLKLSAYYKKYSHLTKIETPYFSGFQAYGPPLMINAANSLGKGKAKGFEVFFKDKTSIKYAEFFFSYSYLNTKRNFVDYTISATPTFAPKHTLNANIHKFSNKLTWIFAANYAFNNGRTYFNPNNASLMGDRVKDFHNLSASISHIPRWLGGFSTLSLNINNILGLDQVYGYRYSYDGSTRVPILPPAKRSVLLSFLMNLDGQDFNR